MRSAQVTIKDIAKMLGVSPSTVSRALKDHPDISPETKKKITETAKKLNYNPNYLALSLKKSKSNTIGVIIPELVHFFFSTVISGIEDISIDAGYNVMVCQSNENYEREVLNANSLLAHRVDGILISVTKESENFDHIKNLINNNIPIVFFDRVVEEIKTDVVVVDDYIGAYLVTRHLLDIGRRRIVHLAAPDLLQIGSLRKKGYLKALDEFNIQPEPELIFQCDTREKAEETVEKILALNPLPDAIFSVNDFTAIAAMQGLKKAGIKIPEQIAMAGFGNGPLGVISDPTLTTVEQKGYDIGREAARLLIERIEKNTILHPRKKVFSPALIKRESTFIT